jgi:hypothetical protein
MPRLRQGPRAAFAYEELWRVGDLSFVLRPNPTDVTIAICGFSSFTSIQRGNSRTSQVGRGESNEISMGGTISDGLWKGN